MKELILIRHTTPNIAEGTCYGHLDLDVTESFDTEAKSIKEAIATYNPDIAYSSPLIRCSKLASYLFKHIKIVTDQRLLELDFGDWEGLLWKDIPKREIDKWAPDFINQSPPNGESFKDLIQRVKSFENEILKSKSKKTAVICHSGIMRCFLMKYLSIPAESIFNLHLNYSSVIKIVINSKAYHQVEFLKG